MSKRARVKVAAPKQKRRRKGHLKKAASKGGIDQAPGADMMRGDGHELRRSTIYFPADVAEQLRLHCTKQGMQMSGFVSRAVAQALGR